MLSIHPIGVIGGGIRLWNFSVFSPCEMTPQELRLKLAYLVYCSMEKEPSISQALQFHR